jgi:hypothetical protein
VSGYFVVSHDRSFEISLHVVILILVLLLLCQVVQIVFIPIERVVVLLYISIEVPPERVHETVVLIDVMVMIVAGQRRNVMIIISIYRRDVVSIQRVYI